MKILMTTSEAVPFAKTGGLADAVSALSLSLAALGHDVRIVMPRYYPIDRAKLELIEGPLGVPVGWGEEWAAIYRTTLPVPAGTEHEVPVYMVDHENFFGRDGIYGIPSEPDFADNPRRFSFFSRSVFQLCRKLGWYPDIFHAHDWPTALVPVFLKHGERTGPFGKSSSVFTIHNIGYQGVYAKEFFPYTKLDWDLFRSAGFEDWDRMNLLKAGLVCADKLTTVSPTYAEETKTSAYGFRLDGVLRAREGDYAGILNGVDFDLWNPSTDTYIPVCYDRNDLSGKAIAKSALQKEFGLPVDPDVPVIGMVTRLTEQKGVGELFGPSYGSAWSICQDMALQFAILGSGERWCENELRSLSARLPNFRATIGYSERLSHMIEAGSDFFLMPSRYEPCGLNQMYSLAYGTPPIVRRTGGLADTVENYVQETGEGTGFMFDELTPRSIYDTVGWAVWAYYNKREDVEAMRIRGMELDFTWETSARRYLALYEKLAR
ncbi:MAG: glycogen synthase [Treponema sp. GWB1_62_6]|nr:MAG: glycogen synthase [Treponema sp. GWC1_61_84]OHE66568.1 MAG: glycogen synthase [Treponema sp. GWA1_62_8]OHE71869.1 MAG: glycogen synthase [Treponema sp. GWB1_62_6]OHE76040.1 MAG: glycogen synthase [Treponema sp. RIFOXYC1_FULL_61_9]HCM26814.1 glycogen synthase [Treponema sp.]